MAKSIRDSLDNNVTGFYIGHRLVLPFRCQLIKIIIEGDIFTEMVGSSHIKIQQDSKNTSIYFRETGKLNNFVGSYKVIKLIVSEWDDDLCNIENHIKLVCEIQDDHKVLLQEPDDDMLFIE